MPSPSTMRASPSPMSSRPRAWRCKGCPPSNICSMAAAPKCSPRRIVSSMAASLSPRLEARRLPLRLRASIATNVDRIAKRLAEGWRDGSALEKAFLGPGPDNPYYRAPKEVTLDLLKAFASGIELVRDQKLGKPLGASPGEAQPKLAAFTLSGLTLANVADNLDGVRELFVKSGFAASLRPTRRALRTRSCSTSTTPST